MWRTVPAQPILTAGGAGARPWPPLRRVVAVCCLELPQPFLPQRPLPRLRLVADGALGARLFATPCHRAHAAARPASGRRASKQPQRWRPPSAAMQATADGLPLEQPSSKMRAVITAACAAMLLAALHRVSFSVLAVPIQQQFSLTLPEMGLLQSALLTGYVFGQIPLGMAADRVGGARLLTVCLFLWSLASLLFSRAPSAASPFAFMLATRAALGLCQSCIMPAVSSLSARWLPPEQRSKYTSTIYAFYSVGTVTGLALTPVLAQQVGWPAVFFVFGLAGMAYAALSIFTLPAEGQAAHVRHAAARPQPQQQRGGDGGGEAAAGGKRRLGAATAAHLLLLCFTHSVISWAFFILQAWIPTFIHSLKVKNLEMVGVLSALPWLATAVVSVLAGSLADWLQTRRQMSVLTIRRLMQSISLLGAALSMLPLVLLPQQALPAPLAVALLTAAVAAQGFNYSGYHSYVQDVAPRDAGLVLGITNTCGTVLGIAGNIITGHLAGSPLGYRGVWGLTVVLHVLATVLWNLGARGERLQLT